MLLDSRLADLETHIGAVIVHSNLLWQSNGNQDVRTDYMFAGFWQDALKVNWTDVECLNFPFYYLFNIHCTESLLFC